MTDTERGRELDAGQVMELGEQECRSLAFRDPGESALHVARKMDVHDEALRRRGRSTRLTRPRKEPDDLAPTDLVERDAVGDLVQPRARVLGLLERVVVLVRLDERVLGEVGGQLGLAEHAQQVGVDLVVMFRKERLDEGPRLLVVPRAAHRPDTRSGRGMASEGAAGWGKSGIGDHRFSVRKGPRSAVDGQRTLVGPETAGLLAV